MDSLVMFLFIILIITNIYFGVTTDDLKDRVKKLEDKNNDN